MLAHVIIAYLHYLGIMTLMATLLAEYVTLQPQMQRVHIRRLAITDLFSGIAAVVILITGLLRFAYFGKGTYFYLGNPLFYLKVGLFLLAALISIYPTRRFLAWQKMLERDQLPAVELPGVTRLRSVIRLELALLLVIPLLAVLMARGIGLTS